MLVLGTQGRNRIERLSRDGVNLPRIDTDDLSLGPSQGRELSAKGASCININGFVQPLSFWYGCVTVNDGGFPAVIQRPLIADGETEFIDFSGGFSV